MMIKKSRIAFLAWTCILGTSVFALAGSRGQTPWWVDFQRQWPMASGDGLSFDWPDERGRIAVRGEIEFVFLGDAALRSPSYRHSTVKAFFNAISAYWTVPRAMEGSPVDMALAGYEAVRLDFSEVRTYLLDGPEHAVAAHANRVYFYLEGQRPRELLERDFLNVTFPTIAGMESEAPTDPFWTRKGQALLPAFTQFLALPKLDSPQFSARLSFKNPEPRTWNLQVAHEFGHALGLRDAWLELDEGIYVNDVELMSYLRWELNANPRATPQYFAAILMRLFDAGVSWQENGKCTTLEPLPE